MSDHRRIAIDLQPIQGYSSRHRGIGRYVLELVTAIVKNHRDRVHSLLINPRRAIPPELERFLGMGLLQAHSAQAPVVNGTRPDIYYVTSPFELDLTLDEVWPRWARDASVDTVVTLYDLIPTLFPDEYLAHPIWQAKYWARLEFVKQANLLLCISQATAHDALEHLGFATRSVTNIGTGVSGHFFHPEDRAQALSRALGAVEGLRPGFLMYTGGIDYRKNLPGLFKAYSLLSDQVRAENQLVIVCRVLPTERDALMDQARALGIEHDTLITGFVPDTTLSNLYQSAALFVFPSIYEGFGLPVAEAVLSGTLAIASDSSSIVELVTDPDLRFDPHDPHDIARCITNALNIPDAAERRGRQHALVTEHFHWQGVAQRAVDAMDALIPRQQMEPGRRRPRIAMVTPLPPAASGIADYSWRLANALAAHVDVDLVTDGPLVADNPTQPTPELPHVSLISGHGLLARDSVLPYDEVIYVMGNSSHHASAYRLMEQRRGSVMIHEARFTGFFEWYGKEQGYAPGWFYRFLRQEYEGVEPSLGDAEWLTYSEAADEGLYLVGPLVDMADRVLTTSAFTAELARLHRPDRRDDIVDIGFGYPEPAAREHDGDVQWLATFGYQHAIKAVDIILEAFALLSTENPHLRLAIVGQVAQEYLPVIEGVIKENSLADRVVVTSRIDSQEYASWLQRTDIAIQLRRATNGEVSAAIGDCLRFGIPTIVTALGPAADLPDAVVHKVLPGTDAPGIAAAIQGLLSDAGSRSEFGANARAYVQERSFDAAALRLLDAVGVLPRR